LIIYLLTVSSRHLTSFPAPIQPKKDTRQMMIDVTSRT